MGQMKVLLVLRDGLRPDCIRGHPAIPFLRETGRWCLDARTVFPPVPLPCHMSLFHSVDPGRHGITTIVYVPQVRPVPGLFEGLAERGLRCAHVLQLGGAAGPGPAREPGSEPVYL